MRYDGITLSLDSLGNGIPALTQALADTFKEACVVCFMRTNHRSGVVMLVSTETTDADVEVDWIGEYTEDLYRNYGNQNATTDFAACGIALLMIRELTDYTAIEQSNTGTTIDYYLGPQSDDNMLIFNKTARLEVSGILQENEKNTVEKRVKEKAKRLNVENDLKDLIIVVEFSRPWAKMIEA